MRAAVLKVTAGAKESLVRLPALPKEGRNDFGAYATLPPLATVTGANVAPVGTVTTRASADALCTTAFVAPKYTMFSAGVELKLAPEMVTLAPTGAESGATELI